MKNKIENWLKQTIPKVWEEKLYNKLYFIELSSTCSIVIEWEFDYDNEEYCDGSCPCISIRQTNSPCSIDYWIIPTLQTYALEQEIFQERIPNITNWLLEQLNEAEKIIREIKQKRSKNYES